MRRFEIQTFALLIMLIGINSQCNELSNPVNAIDCTVNNDSTNYCCMLSSPGYNPTTKMCTRLPRENFIGQTLYLYNSLTWKLNCGDAPVIWQKGQTCGNPNPQYQAECWDFSNAYSSCCYYLSGNTTGTAGCQWLGNKNMGNTTNEQNIILSCSGMHNKLSLFLILTLLNLIFIL